MTFYPDIHHRRSIRIPGYDYSQTNAYFVTVCAYRRERLFGEIRDGEMRANEIGKTVQMVWDELPKRHQNIEIDEFVIMPNHVHGIFWVVVDPVGAPLAGALPVALPVALPGSFPMVDPDGTIPTDGPLFGRSTRAGTRPAPTVGDVIGGFKSITTVEYIRRQKSLNVDSVVPKLWQRNYYERVIRSDRELFTVRQYIRDNPSNWDTDPER